jgi:hypothetical protein
VKNYDIFCLRVRNRFHIDIRSQIPIHPSPSLGHRSSLGPLRGTS